MAREQSSGEGGSVQYGGASYDIEYLQTTIRGVLVDPDRLKDMQEWNAEEMHLLLAGEFFMAGPLWLFVEKLFDDPRPVPMLLVCVLSMVFGGILFWVGWRQRKRRLNWIDSLIENTRKIDPDGLRDAKAEN